MKTHAKHKKKRTRCFYLCRKENKQFVVAWWGKRTRKVVGPAKRKIAGLGTKNEREQLIHRKTDPKGKRTRNKKEREQKIHQNTQIQQHH